jgi:transcriptional regulator with XRE-family HTH domain
VSGRVTARVTASWTAVAVVRCYAVSIRGSVVGLAENTAGTPEIMRRRLRIALRRYRLAAGFTQKTAARALDWSSSKIIRIESGAVGVTSTDVRALLDLYGVRDPELVAELVELARGSKKQSWRQYSDVYSSASLMLFSNEAAAQVMYKYEPTVIPGLLQTEEYARALLMGLSHSSDKVERMVRARLERQELLERDPHPELHFIIGEAAVSRPVGGRGVMANQLEFLKDVSRRPELYLQILPLSIGAHPSMGVAFTILQFVDMNLDDLLYLETAIGEATHRDEAELIADYRHDFLELQERACNPEAFERVIDMFMERLDRPEIWPDH